MSNDKTYNGWTNYETWCVALWLDNDQASSEYMAERAANVWADAKPGKYEWQTADNQAIETLADELKDQHEEAYLEALPKHLQASVFSDLLSAAFGEVNWREIAKGYIDTAKENAPQPPSELSRSLGNIWE
jgi:hypothetical protein